MKEADAIKDTLATNFRPKHLGAYGEFSKRFKSLLDAVGACEDCHGRGYVHLPTPAYCNCVRSRQLRDFIDGTRDIITANELALPFDRNVPRVSSTEGEDSKELEGENKK